MSRIIVGGGGRQKQANWNETDPTSPQFILNKPDITAALTREFVDELPDPQDAQANVIYMVPKQDPETGDGYNEYLLNPDTMEFELIGSTSVEVNPAHPFKPEWYTDTTLAAFIADVNADTDAVEGTYFSGELTCSGLPNEIGNAECRVDVLTGSTSLDKIFVLTIYSTNVAPYHYELMVDGGVAGTWHWTGDGTITVQRNGQTAGSFTTNQNTNTTIDIEVPEYTSDLINDTDIYLTEEEYEALEAAGQLDEDINYHIQGNIPTKTSDLTNDSGFITEEQVPPANDGELDIRVNGQSQGTFTANQEGDTSIDIPMATPQQNVILGRQTQDWYGTQAEFDTLQQAGQLSPFVNYYIENALAQVATSGSYTDLSNQPTIPDEISDLTDDVNVYLTQAEFDELEQQGQLQEDKVYHVETVFADVAVTGSYNDLTDKPTIPACNNKYDLSTKSQAELANFYQNYQTIMDTNTLFYSDYPVVSVGSVVDPGTALTVILVEYNPFALSSTVLGGTYHTLAAGVKVILPDGSIEDSSATMKLADANHLATVATSGSYADLSNKPSNIITGTTTAYQVAYMSEADYALITPDANTIYFLY